MGVNDKAHRLLRWLITGLLSGAVGGILARWWGHSSELAARYGLESNLASFAVISLMGGVGGVLVAGAICFAIRGRQAPYFPISGAYYRQHRQLQLASRVFECANEGIMITDANNRIVAVNQAFTRITGYTPEAVIGRDPEMLSSGRHDAHFYAQMWAALAEHGCWQGEVWNRRQDGSFFPEWLSITEDRDDQHRLQHYIATFSDLTERKEAEARVRYLADHDVLTGLANRHGLAEQVRQDLRIAEWKGHSLALMFMDLDRFQTINDSLGHRVGDQLLQQMALRLQETLGPAGMVARLGGDDFVILMPVVDSPNQAADMTRQLQTAVSTPFVLGDHSLLMTSSVGIALYPMDGHDFDLLLRNADAALNHAKRAGRDNFQFFTPSMNAQVLARLTKENALRQALSRNEFRLMIQPQVRLEDSQLCGCEVLIRWHHPEWGLVPPDQFIPLAEETGLIQSIGLWVLRESCLEARRWLDRGLPPLMLSVNLSALQFRSGLVDWVEQVLAETGYPARWLEVEVTESVLMEDPEHAVVMLQAMKALGIRVALDDFGTGYSSLAYLKRFPIDKLKIDRAFIDGLPDDGDDIALVRLIIDIARHLNLETIAEGVEKEDQRVFLLEAGCQQLQGFLFAPPLAPEDFLEWRQQHTSRSK
ncbi:hypothetical protein BFW38_13865 [Terasakiispira papahanaumokuakeensis]|uniref:cyclic-guanylate-specific phosphodiesterase n=1 Tax=Terasakiispira papahanaumokuakeensis TaxID=197479 RepID=A0A1E2VCS2_9GAMM|nr:EAL domain-containing protein [Terasakiispira papahanaumokuakeensis]ODC04455.1 hypothetical protein BFW38_13865 [Terasakiispira papahanaumokuakeensis]